MACVKRWRRRKQSEHTDSKRDELGTQTGVRTLASLFFFTLHENERDGQLTATRLSLTTITRKKQHPKWRARAILVTGVESVTERKTVGDSDV